MGLLQPDARYRGRDGPPELTDRSPRSGRPRLANAVAVFTIEHARAAIRAAASLNVTVTLVSPPCGAASVGAGWFSAVVALAQRDFPDLPVTAILDCGDRADLAQAALREGLRDVCFRGDPRLRRKLADIARKYGARLHARLPEALDLTTAADPLAACRDWLQPRRQRRIEMPQAVVYSSPPRNADRPRPTTRRTP